MLDLAVSMRKQEWPNQVICMTCPELARYENLTSDIGKAW